MNALRPLVLALTVAGALLVPAQKANASLVYSAAGSGVCKASDGQSTNLQFSPLYVRNKSAVAQYVTCNVGFIRERIIGLQPGAGYRLKMSIVSSSATPQTVTCTAVVGPSAVVVQSTKSVLVSSAAPGELNYTAAELRAYTDTTSLAAYCRLLPGTAISVFIVGQPEVNLL
ncbi:MAG TPA: hypothetical protein VHF02_04520 [Luteimonas sp.]|nr:hypothetical protein [Luteimonas sp.]